MDSMNQQMKALEQHPDLDAGIIKSTKINKVLKAILKLDDIPLEGTYNFKDRSSHMLAAWAPALGLDPATAGAEPTASKEPTTNGLTHDKTEPKAESEEPAKSTDAPETAPEGAAESTETAEPAEASTDSKEGGDVSMTDAPAEPAPAGEATTAA